MPLREEVSILSRTKGVCLAAATAACLAAAAPPAHAACYEMIGCTDSDYFRDGDLMRFSCQILWEVRNTMYKERGYCFHTARAIAAFGNAGCRYDNEADVPLSRVERANVSAIVRVERATGC